MSAKPKFVPLDDVKTDRVITAARAFVSIHFRCREGNLRPWGRKYKQAVQNLAVAVLDYEESNP